MEDILLPYVSTETILDKRARASEAAKASFRSRVAALGAETLREAADARSISRSALEAWVYRGHSKSFFRGPRRAWVARPEALDTELETWRCSWEQGCTEYALLSARPEGERLCKKHDAAVPRNGKMTATEFADKHRVDELLFLWRIKKREIPAERVERGGRWASWLIEEEPTLQLLKEKFPCGTEGCPRYGLGDSRHCSKHASAATAIANARGKVRRECANCGSVREDFPSQQRDGELCQRCYLESEEFDRKRHEAVSAVWDERHAAIDELRAEGLVPWRDMTPPLHLSPTSSNGTRLAQLGLAHERVVVRGFEFVLFHQDDVPRFTREWVKGGDDRRQSWLKVDHAFRRLAARGIPIDSATRERFKMRPQLRKRRSPGRPQLQELHQGWRERFDQIRTWNTAQVYAGELDRVPSVWAMCREVAADHEDLREEFAADPKRTTRRVYQALVRL